MRVIVRNEGQLRGAFSSFIGAMVHGKPYEVWIRPFKQRRSLDQNAKMHVMIRELAKHIGYSESEMKNVLKSEYGPVHSVRIGDRDIVVPKSTADYDRAQAGEMIELIQMLGAETGCVFQEATDTEADNGCGQ